MRTLIFCLFLLSSCITVKPNYSDEDRVRLERWAAELKAGQITADEFQQLIRTMNAVKDFK